MISRALIAYYRCPEEFVRMSLAAELSADEGYFRFGDNVCYGQTASGYRASSPTDLYDTLPDASMNGERLCMPFDPSQVVDNLRFERYAAEEDGRGARRETLWRQPYYALRPLIPAALRRALQRLYLRDWRQLSFPRWPIDDTVDTLLERLLLLSLRGRGIERVPFIWFWPDGAPSCAILTHDIETSEGLDRCAWLMSMDERAGIKASFQVVPEERYSVSGTFLDDLRARGFEINVHDLNHDGLLFSSREEFLRRVKKINAYVRAFRARGFRSGSLYRHAGWFDALHVAYDMSIPNAGHLEIQRGGCCTVMPYFIGGIVELPLTTTQDYTLFHILKDYSSDVWKNQIESVMGRHGLVSLIVHPDYQTDERPRRAYLALLDQLASLRDAGRCWLALPGEVDRWWRARDRMRLVRDGDGWRIEGKGSERARVAYAQLDGDEVVYRLEPASPRAGGVAVQ
jgi:hypothetical protein